MAGEWAETKLEDVSDDITVGFVGSMSSLFIDRGVPLLRGQNIQPGRLDLTNLKYISTETHQKWKKSALKAGDVVIVRVGYPGTSCVIPEGMGDLNAASLVIVRPSKNKLDSHFLCYVLNSELGQQLIRGRLVGSVQQVFNTGTAASLEVLLPPLAEQKAIAAVLGALDDKIELNRRMNATLEAMARALFQSWFVDFDPVRAKLDGRKPEGMDTETAALFPEHLEDSPLGHIPKGWKVGKIQDCCVQIQNGGTPRRNEPRFWDNGDIPWLASGEVRQPIITATESFITEEGLAESSAKWVPAFSTVVALYGATAGQVSFTSSRLTTNQAVCALIPKKDFAFFNYLTMRGATADLENKAVGSAQQNISKGIVEETSVVLPPTALVEYFAATVSPLFERWISNLHQSRTLRDTLLPKLLSGEVKLREEVIT